MAIQFQNFTALVQNSAAAVQGACAQLLDLTVGSVLRAILEANASVALWIEWLIVQVLSVTRLATSTGTDVDTFVNDFALARLPAVPSSGFVTFSRFSTGSATIIPVGAQIKTGDGTEIFTVIADPTNVNFDAANSGYDVGVNASVLTPVPVVALTPGSGGNVQPNTITLIASAIPGIDTVTNPVAFVNGVDQESDAALRSRFILYIAGLSKGTPAAVAFAIATTQQGLNYAIIENSPAAGEFLVVIDDGSGNPPIALLNAVFAAIDLVRPVATEFAVQPPVIFDVTITFTITVAPGVIKGNLIGPAETAVAAFVNDLTIGAQLPYTKVAQVVYDSAPAGQILNVTALLLNNATTDIVSSPNGVIKVTSVVAS